MTDRTLKEPKTGLPQFVVLKRAIIYARVSTDEQAEHGTSLDNQVEKSLAYAEANGMKVSSIFREDYTGKEFDRPELSKVRALLKAGGADALIAYKPNRLDRSEWGVNLLILLQELKSLGVELHYSQHARQINLDNPVEALMQSIEGWQAGEDHRETVTKLYEGRIAKVRQNNPMVHSRAPYGYRVVRDGKDWRLEIDEAEAKVIKLIFEWYVYGDPMTGRRLSAYAIARKLTALKIPTRADKDRRFKKSKRSYGEWYAATVGYMLGCETYAGTWHYGKKGNDKSDWIAVDVPAIIDREVWGAAQKLKARNKAEASRRMTHDYLLAKRLTCGCCNEYKIAGFASKSRGKHYAYYRCGGLSHGFKCDLPNIRADQVDAVVWGWLESILTDPDPEKLKKRLEGYQAEQAQKVTPVREQIGVIDGLLNQHNDDLDEAIASLKAVSSPRARARIAADIERIEGILDGLEIQKAELTSRLKAETLTKEQFATITEWAAQIAADIEVFRQDFKSRRLLIELLDVRGRLVTEDGQKAIYIRAKLAPGKERLFIETKSTGNSRLQIIRLQSAL